MTKGTLVELYGRISVTAYTDAKGEAKGSLNFHVNSIKMHGRANEVNKETVSDTADITGPVDDLPF